MSDVLEEKVKEKFVVCSFYLFHIKYDYNHIRKLLIDMYSGLLFLYSSSFLLV